VKLPDVLTRPDLEMVALDYFRRLGHDNHGRLSKLYAWEESGSNSEQEARIPTRAASSPHPGLLPFQEMGG
jgi:hypothetical protein